MYELKKYKGERKRGTQCHHVLLCVIMLSFMLWFSSLIYPKFLYDVCSFYACWTWSLMI